MTQALHILRKDLKRLRWLLLVWIALLIARVVSWGLGARPTGGFAYALLVSQSTSMLGVLQMLMLALVAARLVHEESLVGSDAFWLTRPYSRNALMAAKLLFAAGVLVALPLVADLATMGIYHAGVHAQAVAAPTLISSYVTWALLLLALAAVTPSLGSFVLTIVAAVAGLSIFAMILFTTLVFVSEPTRAAPTMPDPTPGLVATAIVILSMLAVIAYQYRHRRWRRAVAIAVAGLVASLATSLLWATAFGPAAAPDPGGWSRDAASRVIVDRELQMEVNRREAFREERPRRQVFARTQLAGMPREMVIQSADIDSTLTLPGGVQVRSRPGGGVTRPVADTEWPGQLGAKRAALGGVALVRGMNEGNAEYWPSLVALDEQDYARAAGRPGRLDATMQFHLNRTRLRGVLPLRAGAALDDGVSRIEILRTELDADGLLVAVRRWKVFSPMTPRRNGFFEYVLRNRSRQEALTAGGNGSLPMPSPGTLTVGSLSLFGTMSAGMDRDGFAIEAGQFRFQKRIARPGEVRTFDAAWFDGAELAVLETGYAGSVTRTVTINDFTVPAN